MDLRSQEKFMVITEIVEIMIWLENKLVMTLRIMGFFQ